MLNKKISLLLALFKFDCAKPSETQVYLTAMKVSKNTIIKLLFQLIARFENGRSSEKLSTLAPREPE